ncbi:uncharacterized protein LOC128987926 [Macrosteles quadrilineatus]|uniref:uncharacterized protein LOC128987926 n=1 Tax=Macrosteles quadrilineatus TaxID=74068 RepID=UPI0023E34AE0|nr:uncharacterized protein LOC128987926 [Macrosteles quadrilineatus]
MLKFEVLLSALLAVLITGVSADPENETDNRELSLLNVGVPLAETKLGPNPALDGYNRRRVRAIYYWSNRNFCYYKFKVEAVTTSEVAGKVETGRNFLIISLDYRPLDVVEVSDSNSFNTDDAKLGRFILRQTVWSCDKLSLEFRMPGGGCRARNYKRVKKLTPEMEQGQRILVEDFEWEAYDDECGSPELL